MQENQRLFTMSQKELSRLEVMQLIKERRLTQIQAVEMLNVNLRHVKRLYKQYKQDGASGLISNRRGKPSNRKLPNNIKELCLALIEKHYYDFGPTLAQEKLKEIHEIDNIEVLDA